MWRSFDIIVVTYRMTNFLPKLVDILRKELNFHFLNSPISGCCPSKQKLATALIRAGYPEIQLKWLPYPAKYRTVNGSTHVT